MTCWQACGFQRMSIPHHHPDSGSGPLYLLQAHHRGLAAPKNAHCKRSTGLSIPPRSCRILQKLQLVALTIKSATKRNFSHEAGHTFMTRGGRVPDASKHRGFPRWLWGRTDSSGVTRLDANQMKESGLCGGIESPRFSAYRPAFTFYARRALVAHHLALEESGRNRET